MASVSFIIGIIGNVISILMFASPIGTFRRVVKKKSTEDYQGIPYITTLLCTSLWVFYGLLNPDGLLVITVNAAGAVLQFIYVTLFLIYAPKDTKVKMVKLVAISNIGFLGAVIAVTLLALHGSMRLTFAGFVCAGLTIGMYAAPLSVMSTVIKTKSVEYMPFFLSFFQFINGGVWSVYAVLKKDFYIGVPNAVGFFLGLAQLIIYMRYKDKSKPAKLTYGMEEEGSAHLVKGSIEMQNIDEDEEAQNMQNIDKDEEAQNKLGSLRKGRSLPSPSQLSFQKIKKALTLSPQSSLPYERDIENGGVKEHF